MAQNNAPSCLILAAGFSRRFGSAKLHVRMGDGRSLLDHTIDIYTRLFDSVHVVVRSDDRLPAMPWTANPAVVVVHNAGAHHGLSESIKCGVQASTTDAGWLIALADMPYVQPRTVDQLLTHAAPDRIVVPVCQGQQGNPVFWGADYATHLQQLQGDRGAKSLLTTYSSAVVRVHTEDDGVLHDVDVPSDIR